MIYITRPIIDAYKSIPKITEKPLDNKVKDQNYTPRLQDGSKTQTEKFDYNQDDLKRAIADTNRVLFEDNDHFEFKIHEGTGRIMVKLVDNETDEVIKEIPPEKILDLVASIWDLVGILVDERG